MYGCNFLHCLNPLFEGHLQTKYFETLTVDRYVEIQNWLAPNQESQSLITLQY